ncbi:MAG: glycerate kinase [Actinobacteria bacterium]|nr:glycerate kinase [Actinomycetota bacterium]
MQVLVAPDKFAGTLTAVQAAAAIAEGWRRTSPDDAVVLLPLADGGPGFLDVVEAALGGRRAPAVVTGPLREPVAAAVLLVDGTAYVETAQACGLHLMPEQARDPRRTTSYGVGELIALAVAEGATTVVLGLGGSATSDGGAGLLAALGATAEGPEGLDVTALLSEGTSGLRSAHRVDLGPARRAVEGVRLVAASDVDNPLLGLRGAANGFARQKGADDAAVMEIEGALEHLVAVLGRRPDGKDPAVALGAGAAGGLGYALLHLGAERVPGIATVLETVRFPDRVREADVVVTGEGSFDWQSLRGKVVSGVAEAALAEGRGCVVLAGRVEVGRREYAATGVSGAYAVVDHLAEQGLPPEAALDDPAARLADLAERAARTWGG